MRLASGHAHDGCQRTQQYVVLSNKRLFFYRAKFSPPHKAQTPPGNLKEPSVRCLPPSLVHLSPSLTWDGIPHSLSLPHKLFTLRATFSFHFALCNPGRFCTFLLIPSELSPPADVTQLQLETLGSLVVSFK